METARPELYKVLRRASARSASLNSAQIVEFRRQGERCAGSSSPTLARVTQKVCLPSRVRLYAVARVDASERSNANAESRGSRTRRVLFVVSRDQPERYDSLARAFSGDDDVQVIFDRRRFERRQADGAPRAERREHERRSEVHERTLQTIGWVRIPTRDEPVTRPFDVPRDPAPARDPDRPRR